MPQNFVNCNMRRSKTILLIILVLLGFKVSKAQYLSTFTAVQIGAEVELSIVVAAGNTCNGMNILRSPDGINYSEIGNIAGICGSTSEDVKYSWTDTDPLRNSVNYYRIDLITLGYSLPVTVFYLHFDKSPVLMYPNPVTSNSNVYLNIGRNDVFDVLIYSVEGRLVKSISGVRGNHFMISAEDFIPGMYKFRVISSRGYSAEHNFIVN
ncbi:MAG: T9SS C-terminal target domain-containing protein [Bacteroidetes bacterium]|nr:MAG: T9SS C-terminal target domain-containing protein [Bacteroidota bacterium]REK05760.1 MAG: T9SS C-terminal target domain-containing protein [Bacteroidota bacterium]REK31933.1 MAG: T9SS C-terminal target domain-containing protein [Bacteroidota bacterium]REK49999.1 MAG: T9SS C-terminal target domain-containing protein [Bacteroidota bacterium]